MPTKGDALERLDAAYVAFREAFAGLDEEQMTQVWFGEWSVREIVAHVVGWHREAIASLERLARGERPRPEGVDYSDTNRWNARFTGERRELSVAQVVADLEEAFAIYRAAAAALPEERFEPGRVGDRMFQTNINHLAEHGVQVRQWRQGAEESGAAVAPRST